MSINKIGYYFKIRIISIEKCTVSRIIDDVMTKIKEEDSITHILTFDKCFENSEDAQKYIESKPFQRVFKAVLSNF